MLNNSLLTGRIGLLGTLAQTTSLDDASPAVLTDVHVVLRCVRRPPTDPALMSSFLAAAKGSNDWQERLPPLYIHSASGHPLSLHHTAQQRPHWGPSMYSGGVTRSDSYTGSGFSGSGGREGYVMDRWAGGAAGLYIGLMLACDRLRLVVEGRLGVHSWLHVAACCQVVTAPWCGGHHVV